MARNTVVCQCGSCRKCKSREYTKRWYDKNRRKNPALPHGNYGKRYFTRSKVPNELLAATPEEIIWAAGLFEGEGSVFPERRKGERRNYVTPRMSLNSTDLDVVKRFQAIMGGRVRAEKIQRPEQKQQWKWTLYGYDAACRAFELWRPWLGTRRTAQFERTIREVDEVRATL